MSIILGLETSCDETAAAVVKDGRIVLASELNSQTDIHAKFGGVVPEVAARYHLESVNEIIDLALTNSGVRPEDLDAVACTQGPGLIGTLLVGLSAAKAISWVFQKPLLAVDHLYAHICANYIDTDLAPPFICLLVSGGHTQTIHVKTHKDWEILGQTLDDAAGEAYDKVARLLGLGYPGGPMVDKMAQEGNPLAFKFPEGNVKGYDFSFSGLKTSVLRTVEKLPQPLPVNDLAASFQDAVNRVLFKKTVQAARELQVGKIVLAGGVAANKDLRRRFTELSGEGDISVFIPAMKYCTDNAAMVASCAYFAGVETSLDCMAYSRQSSGATL
ncbi:MAG: tRNA (adenosine(37)-N6)-threonylcarbamoyltransferase complex transferase subunit TsaD [Candidatus Melainabacteria bacterium]|nr:tRNA (adenosine(37)-N6)-threonylcarbamoyltransferase complex transferase subunit TsaD [Candidatus Melainabacteria bacterium]